MDQREAIHRLIERVCGALHAETNALIKNTAQRNSYIVSLIFTVVLCIARDELLRKYAG